MPCSRGDDDVYVSSDGAWLIVVSGPARDAYAFADVAERRLIGYLGRAPTSIGFDGDTVRWVEGGAPRSLKLQ